MNGKVSSGRIPKLFDRAISIKGTTQGYSGDTEELAIKK